MTRDNLNNRQTHIVDLMYSLSSNHEYRELYFHLLDHLEIADMPTIVYIPAQEYKEYKASLVSRINLGHRCHFSDP